MRESARPALDAESGVGERELPYKPAEWSRRLDRAREARAKVLAARETDATTPREQETTGDQCPERSRPWDRSRDDEEKLATAAPPAAEPARGAGRRSGIRLVAGFSAGVAVGALVAVILLSGLVGSVRETLPLLGATREAPAPSVGTAAAQAGQNVAAPEEGAARPG